MHLNLRYHSDYAFFLLVISSVVVKVETNHFCQTPHDADQTANTREIYVLLVNPGSSDIDLETIFKVIRSPIRVYNLHALANLI